MPRRRRGEGGGVRRCRGRRRRRRGDPARRDRRGGWKPGGEVTPQADAEDLSLLLYTSGTTGRPKGVPRRHRAERAAAIAHVAQNLYGRGERTLGVMPLYHTMGVRSLLAMALVDGGFVCLPRFDPGRPGADRGRTGDQSLSGADALSRPRQPPDNSPRQTFLGDQARICRRGDAGRAAETGETRLSPGAFRQSLRLVGDLHLHGRTRCRRRSRVPPARPGQPAHSRRHAGAAGPEDRAAAGEEGEIIADIASDEAFEGYWRRPDADAPRCAAAGISPAIPDISMPRATCSLPAASTT